MKRLMCHQPLIVILAKVVHKMRVFRDEDGEYIFDAQLDLFDSDEDVGSDLFEDDDEND
jgi:hypothetical protein